MRANTKCTFSTWQKVASTHTHKGKHARTQTKHTHTRTHSPDMSSTVGGGDDFGREKYGLSPKGDFTLVLVGILGVGMGGRGGGGEGLGRSGRRGVAVLCVRRIYLQLLLPSFPVVVTL